MYVKTLIVENIRSFSKEEFHFSPGMNLFVGENNSGKSTIFEALLFATTNARPADLHRKESNGFARVEIIVSGSDLEAIMEDERFARYRDYVYADEEGELSVRVERSDEVRTTTQAGRSVTLDGKKICLWHPVNQKFENPTGIDAVFRSFLDLEPIWATTEPGSIIDFSTTKTLGKLLAATTEGFFETQVWAQFETAHRNAFVEGSESLSSLAKGLADRLSAVVEEQYGHADVRFEFEMPDSSAFVKAGRLHVDDGSGETPLSAKGSGMQRALALAAIQEFARAVDSRDKPSTRPPLILLVDEPETWLHPRAQLKLAQALRSVAGTEQLFVTTHSPYLFGEFESTRDRVICIRANDEHERVIEYETDMGLISDGRPTTGEINFIAFAIPTNDFHNELYGEVVRRLEVDRKKADERAVDQFLVDNGFERSHQWIRSIGGRANAPYSVTLPVYIRNSIHHPENEFNAEVSPEQLHSSISALVRLVRGLKLSETEELRLAS